MKRMNKQVYVAVLMALTTMSINSYAADVTMNNSGCYSRFESSSHLL